MLHRPPCGHGQPKRNTEVYLKKFLQKQLEKHAKESGDYVKAFLKMFGDARTGRAKREGASYLFYTKDEQKRVDTLLRLTRNTDDCRSVHFDFNHEKLVVEEKQNVDKFNIKCYF